MTEVPVPLLIDPSVTVIDAACALYRVITPLLGPVTLATPFKKLIVVVLPKLIADPKELVTVGCVPLGLVLAPPNVRLFNPV